jgi:Tfp pilus assembly protein PilF
VSCSCFSVISHGGYAQYAGPAAQAWIHQAREPALKAIALAPELAEGHLTLATFLLNSLDFKGASEEYERAAALAPGNATVLKNYGAFAVSMGHTWQVSPRSAARLPWTR